MAKIRMMPLEECRFQGVEMVRYKRNLSQAQTAELVIGREDKDWYQRFQRGKMDVGFSQLLAMCNGLKMNLDSALLHMSKAAPITYRDINRDKRVIALNCSKAASQSNWQKRKTS